MQCEAGDKSVEGDDVMWVPDWLYERLPLCYLAIGVSCPGWLGTGFTASLSALSFCAAALLTVRRRRRARSSPSNDGDAIDLRGPGAASPGRCVRR